MPPGQKVNLHRLLRQLETPEQQYHFLTSNNLIPKTAICEHCNGLMDRIFPLNNPSAKFKFFRCPCSNSNKVPVNKDTFLFNANISTRQYIVLLYAFCYRWKYEDVKREADIEGPDNIGEEGYHDQKLSNKTIAPPPHFPLHDIFYQSSKPQIQTCQTKSKNTNFHLTSTEIKVKVNQFTI